MREEDLPEDIQEAMEGPGVVDDLQRRCPDGQVPVVKRPRVRVQITLGVRGRVRLEGEVEQLDGPVPLADRRNEAGGRQAPAGGRSWLRSADAKELIKDHRGKVPRTCFAVCR